MIDWSEWFYYDETSPSCLRWAVNRYRGKHMQQLFIAAGDRAGTNNRGYWRVHWSNGPVKTSCEVHRVVWELFNGPIPEGMQVDHVDGNPSNNVISNLRIVSPAHNAMNRRKRSDCSTGKTGVFFLRVKDRTYVQVQWMPATQGKTKSKYFSVNKLGLLPAFAVACAFRESVVKEMNSGGADYTVRHGI